MGRITSSVGLITGINIDDTVAKLVAIEAKPRDALVTANNTLAKQKTAVTQLEALLLGLQATSNQFGSSSLYETRSIASSDDSVLTATSAGTPQLGSYQFTPLQSASAQQLQSTRFANLTSAIGAGTLTFRNGGFVDAGAELDVIGDGAGLARGKIRIIDRSGASADIDLSAARTVDDVLSAINNNTGIDVTASAVGDRLRLVDNTGQTVSNLKVQEIGAGSTAASLGLATIDSSAGTANGGDVLSLFNELALSKLNSGVGVRFNEALPDIQFTLRDGTQAAVDFKQLAISGSKATATTNSENGLNAKLTFTTKAAGSAADGIVITFVDDSSLSVGSEKVVYNADDKKLTFYIDAGHTTADDVRAALARDTTASAAFVAERFAGSDGSGLVSIADAAATSGGAAVEPSPGTNEQTIGDVLTAINAIAPSKLRAQISSDGDHLELVDLTSGGGAFTAVSLNGSSTLKDLGLTTAAAGGTITSGRLLAGLKTSLLKNLGGTAGLGDLGSINLSDRGGGTATVNLANAVTLDDVVAAINASGLQIKAGVNAARNGLSLTDTSGGAISNLIVANADGTNTADKLKLTVNSATTTKNSGGLSLQVVSEITTLASLNGGAGVSQGTFKITDAAGAATTLSIGSSSETISDVIRQLNTSGLAIEARVNDAGDGLAIIDTTGGSGKITVSEGNSTTGADLHLLGISSLVSVGGQSKQVLNGSTAYKITLSATDTLQNLVDKVNAAASKSVAAQVFSDGSSVKPYRFTLFNQTTGKAGELLVDTSQLSFGVTETVAARDALLLVGQADATGAVLASSSTNSFKNLLNDVTLTVKKASTSAVTISVTNNTNTLVSTTKSFVDNFNRVFDNIVQATKYDDTTKSRGILQGDGGFLRAENDLTGLASGRFFGSTVLQSLKSLGITVQQTGLLQFDDSKLKTQLADNPQAVRDFLSNPESGLSSRFKKVIDSLTAANNSLLVNKAKAIDIKTKQNADRIEFLNARLTTKRDRLTLSFQLAETAIAKLQANQSIISQIKSITSTSSTSTSG